MKKLIVVATIVVSAMFPSYAARTVKISAYDEATREVSLAFGGSSSAAENVYIAYGPADCGGHFHKWPNSVNIGTIATDATSMTYVLPAAVTTGVYYRFFVGDCPYDAELEYIKGDKTSWLLTSYTPSSTNRVETEIYFDTYSTGNTGIEAIYSARNTKAQATFTTLQSGGKLRIDRKNSNDQSASAIVIPLATHYTVSIDYSAETITTNLTAAGGMKTASTGAYTAGGYLALFTINSNGFNVNENSSIERGGGFRMYWFKMYNASTGSLDIDLIPVIVNGSPCMYDKVSGNVLPRLGAAGGAFTAGREIAVAVASTETRMLGGLTVDSVNYSTGDITVSFTALATNAALWAVYSANTDYGAYSPNGWDRYEKLSDIAAGDTSCSAVLPALAGVSDTYLYKHIRLVVAPTTEQPTPFDRQVEYIKSPSTAGPYIDTGIVPYCTDRVVAKVAAEQAVNAFIWSARVGANSSGRHFSCLAGSGKRFRFDRNTKYEKASSMTFTLGRIYDLDVDYKTAIYEIMQGGARLETDLFPSGGTFTPGSNLILFGANNSGTVGPSQSLRFYDFKLILWSGELRLDLIPVVKNGAGCLYDKVSGTVFENAGTGAFEIGAASATRYGMEPLLVSDAFRDERTADAPAYARMVSDGAGGWTWKFYSLEMEEIAFPSISLPDATVTVLFGSTDEVPALLADRTANGWTAGGYKMMDFALASDDFSFPAGFDFMYEPGTAIDLTGHDFTLPTSMRDAGIAFTVTDSSAAGSGGKLFFDVGDGVVYTNELITLSGSLELVKTGAGEFFAAKTGQTYTGGTSMSNGVFRVGGNGDTGVIGVGGVVTVGADATLAMNGKMSFGAFDFVLAGGTLRNDVSYSTSFDTATSITSLRLAEDSSILLTGRYGLYTAGGRTSLDLGGHTLAVTAQGVYFDLADTTVEDGRLVVSASGAYGGIIPRETVIATNNVTLVLNGMVHFYGNDEGKYFDLQNYEAHDTRVGSDNDYDHLRVWGVFTPYSIGYHGLTMMDGSVIDLSQIEGALPSPSSLTGRESLRKLQFAPGATVSVVLTNRADLAEIAASNAPYIVTWSSTDLAPVNVTFNLDAATAAAGYTLGHDEYGIVLADAAAQATPVYAKMVKGAGDEYSWHFYNSLWNDITATAGVTAPNANITVWFGSNAELAAIDADRAANGWTAKGYHTTGFDIPSDNYVLPSDLVISENATIDLKGHAYTLPESLLTADAKFTVTDSSPNGEGGTLTVVVADAATVFDNYNLSFTGSLSFVKDGAGTFTERKNGHTYTGDVTIKGGKLRTVGHGNEGVIGAPCTVTIEEGGTLDICGRIHFGDFTFVLDGGTIINGIGYTTSFSVDTSIKTLRLTKDSRFIAQSRYGFYAGGDRPHIDLGGCTLNISATNCYFDAIDATFENGKVVVDPMGSGAFIPRFAVVASNNVTFVMNGQMEYMESATFDVSDYESHDQKAATRAQAQTSEFRIWRRFTPYSSGYHGLKLMDGATFDLSNLSEALPAVSTLAGSAYAKKLEFADNATIRVNVGNRPLHRGDYLVTWTSESKPTNLSTVKFKCAGGRSFRVEVDDDGEGNGGLRYIPSGMMLIVK